MALAAARDCYPNLRAAGIMGRAKGGPLIRFDDVTAALAFLRRCRRTKHAFIHTVDLEWHVSRWARRPVSVGAIIAAAVGLRFEVRGWRGCTAFYPHAMINANKTDISKLAEARR